MNRAVRAASIGVLLLTPVALSACSAGQVNQTSSQLRDKTGPMAVVGDIVLRQVQVAYPPKGRYSPGDDVELQGAIVNSATVPDTLISITGDGFRGVRLGGPTPSGTTPSGTTPSGTTPSGTTPSGTTPSGATPSGTAPSPGGSASGSASAATSVPASTSPPPGAAPGGGAAASGAPSAATATAVPGAAAATSSAPASAAGSSVSVPIPPTSTVFLGRGTPRITLVGLTQPLTPAQSLRLTFTFQRAGTITVPALVADPTGELTRSSSFDFEQKPSESPGNRG